MTGRPNKITPYLDYVRERITASPELTATRLTRELRERGYTGAYTAVKRFVAAIRPSDGPKPFEVRFETPPGHQAQVDFARFVTVFEDQPGVTRIIWLFSMVLGHSRHIGASRRRSTTTTRRDPDRRPANDLVRRSFFAEKPNELWVADITFVPTLAGFLFLAVVMDTWSRRIVGCAAVGGADRSLQALLFRHGALLGSL